VALGDGGSIGDPKGNGQNLAVLLGKLLRIDPDHPADGKAYGIPTDNPFVHQPQARPEVWAYGLRNPWRFDFLTDGRVILGDVGDEAWEEIDVVAAGDNLGWNIREGRHCFKPPRDCSAAHLVEPIYEYGHGEGVSITGGVIYQGKAIPSLVGQFLFADFGRGKLHSISTTGQIGDLSLLGGAPTAFGRDADGEVYVTDFPGGAIERLEPAAETH
jgi:glucose/arabinose dehydrogenase